MPPLRLFFFWLILGTILPAPLSAGTVLLRHDYAEYPDTFVSVESLLGPAAYQGYVPYRITLRNHSGRSRVWEVTITDNENHPPQANRGRYRIEVAHGAEVTQEVNLPFIAGIEPTPYKHLSLAARSPGLPPAHNNQYFDFSNGYPCVAMTAAMLSRYLEGFADDFSKYCYPYEPATLPTNWISYTGLYALLIDLDSWKSLSSAQRQAILSWVRMGGHLDLYTEVRPDPATLDLPLGPSLKPGLHTFGLGQIRLSHLDRLSSKTSRRPAFPDYTTTWNQERAAIFFTPSAAKDWPLLKQLSSRQLKPLSLLFILFGFAILVAPVNLFCFAKRGKRHRLFFTTPLLSLLCSLILILYILLSDGIGGTGHRVILADLEPGMGENRIYTVQEQISRTGVMLRSGFSSGQTYELKPIPLPNRYLSSRSRPSTRNFGVRGPIEVQGGNYQGGFFPSRSEQGFRLGSVEPSRARIEVSQESAASPPVLRSNLPQKITALHYRDASDQTWTLPAGEVLSPGQSLSLEPLTDPEKLMQSQKEWEEHRKRFSQPLQERLARLWPERERFFAQVDDAEAYALPTHPGIRWEETQLLLTGRARPISLESEPPSH